MTIDHVNDNDNNSHFNDNDNDAEDGRGTSPTLFTQGL